MNKLKISVLESIYLIYMFLFFKTSVDFNIIKSPEGWWLEHLIGDDCGLRICPFGRVAIFGLIFILIARNYIDISQNIISISLGIASVLSLMNLNALIYLLPVLLIEIVS